MTVRPFPSCVGIAATLVAMGCAQFDAPLSVARGPGSGLSGAHIGLANAPDLVALQTEGRGVDPLCQKFSILVGVLNAGVAPATDSTADVSVRLRSDSGRVSDARRVVAFGPLAAGAVAQQRVEPLSIPAEFIQDATLRDAQGRPIPGQALFLPGWVEVEVTVDPPAANRPNGFVREFDESNNRRVDSLGRIICLLPPRDAQ